MFNILRCNSNAKLILIALLATFLLADCIGDEEKELFGNILLLVGQALVILAMDSGADIEGR